MVDSPEEIRNSIEKSNYTQQNCDISQRIRLAMIDKIRHVDVDYFLCDTLKTELRNKGYKVEESSGWFFGDSTLISW